jgi:hypothetical protein
MGVGKRKVLVHGNERWQVDFGRDSQSKRPRKFYKTEDEADGAIDAYLKALKRGGDFWARLSPQERNAAAVVLEEIKAEELTPRQVWEDYKRLRVSKPVVDSKSYAEAVQMFRDRKLAAGRDRRYIEETCDLLMRFGTGRDKKLISNITVDELQTWINAQKWGPHAKKANIGRFSSLWKVAVDMGWVSVNIVERLEPVGKLRVTFKIFDNDTCLNLLAATQANSTTQKATASIVLGLLCGMRPEEIQHQEWGWKCIRLDWGQLTVPPNVAKDGDQRTVKMQPVALEWMKLANKLKCELPLTNERKLIDACCELAGIEAWPHDILRKTCATHLSNQYKNDWAVIRDLGNSIRILLKHYKDLQIPESQSVEFWNFTPDAAKERLKRLLSANRVKNSRPVKSPNALIEADDRDTTGIHK